MKHISKVSTLISLTGFFLSGCGDTNHKVTNPGESSLSLSSSVLPVSSSSSAINEAMRIPGDWTSFTDVSDGGLSTVELVNTIPGPGNEIAEQAKIQLSKGSLSYDPFAGMTLAINADGSPFAGVTYYYRGPAHQIRAEITEVSDYCFHFVQVPESRAWTKVRVAWSDFTQESWGKSVAFSPVSIRALSWNFKGADQSLDSMQVAQIMWADSSEFPAPTPDFVIRPASEPQSVTIGNLTIANPMQTRAMKYLSHGINLTNWLEEDHGFNGFEYDESTVSRLAGFGFKGIRLPIDFDQYVKNKAAYLAGTSAFELDSSLFTPLDSFMVWTKRHGLSLTIDYHQYDGSFTVSNSQNARYRLMMKALWASVATRYASESREDLFYELLNEPDVNIKATTWYSLAQELIDTIRTVDATRPLLFGAVNWYRIPELASTTPFADANMIYVFHFYEPFLYTHQGAPWEKDLAAVRNIPFPYDPARWGNNYAHFGASAAWVKKLIDKYPETGNKTAMKNLIYQAKEWAVKNNVAVICNEFGANTFQGTKVDRITWLTTTVDILEELQIPWQHWGYDSGNDIVDSNLNLLDGMKEAFRLD